MKLDVCRIKHHYLATANCIPIEKRNIFAANGVVHKIDGVMQPISHSISHIIESNAEVSMFRTSMSLKLNYNKNYEEKFSATLTIPQNYKIIP